MLIVPVPVAHATSKLHLRVKTRLVERTAQTRLSFVHLVCFMQLWLGRRELALVHYLQSWRSRTPQHAAPDYVVRAISWLLAAFGHFADGWSKGVKAAAEETL